MDRLSSCYFCGDALDASLDEYPVVPSEVAPSDRTQRTVVLCRGCRRKLDSILDAVVAAVDDPSAVDDPAAGERESRASADRDADAADRSNGATGASAAGVDASAGDGAGDAEDETAPDDRAAESDAGSSISSSLDGGEDVLRPVAGDDDSSSDGTDDGTTEGGRGESIEGGQDESAGSATAAGEGGDASLADGSLTRLEYNKVMRLLQNREFPVRREGFVNVAANAYEISHRECEKILDVAIEHGLIDEEDGQLVEAGE